MNKVCILFVLAAIVFFVHLGLTADRRHTESEPELVATTPEGAKLYRVFRCNQWHYITVQPLTETKSK